jgi:BirA family biotin operon repressor/biotin-[acetyl-CoA-carboxylase] ligase
LQAFEVFSVRENTVFSYRKRLFRLGKINTFEDKAGRFDGIITDVEADGHLLIRDLTGEMRRYAFKEVTFII